MKVRTRYAPSPTGFLHFGAIRTALYCYALSNRYNGQFIVRLEDTDRTRYVAESVDVIFTALDEYGLTPDESMKHGGKFGPYVQSERKETYQKYAEELVQNGHAYYCFLSQAETKDLQERFLKENRRFRSPFRDQELEESKKMIKEGKPYTIRLKVPLDEEIYFEDGLQGKMRFDTNEVDDGVLLKQDGLPTYHLAVVIDDTLMEITHVFRGVEWTSSIPKHVLLYKAFGWEMPKFYHLPVIKDPEGGKLAKRKGATAALEFIKKGYLPEAVLNFLMLLGWSAPIKREHGEAEKELFTLEEFVNLFDSKDLNKSNPVFNQEKLDWFSKKYIQNTETEDLKIRFITWLEKYAEDSKLKEHIIGDLNLTEKLSLVKDRAMTLVEVMESLSFFYELPKKIDWDIKQLNKIEKSKLPEIKTKIKELITSFRDDTSTWTHEEWEEGMRKIGDDMGYKHGDIFMVLRMCVVGSPFSPPLFGTLQVLGKDEVLKRIG